MPELHFDQPKLGGCLPDAARLNFRGLAARKRRHWLPRAGNAAPGHFSTAGKKTLHNFSSPARDQLLEERDKKKWRVSLLHKDVEIRKQAEKLAKFLLWSKDIVKDAVSAQPYAALAWSGVSLLLPVCTYLVAS